MTLSHITAPNQLNFIQKLTRKLMLQNKLMFLNNAQRKLTMCKTRTDNNKKLFFSPMYYLDR